MIPGGMPGTSLSRISPKYQKLIIKYVHNNFFLENP